jgi:ribosomal protein S18 acetylase RimI-like enzyme
MKEVRIIPIEEQHLEGYWAAVDAVARERRYIGFVEGPPLEGTRSFVREILAGAGVQMLAVTLNNEIVGWCDIIWNPLEGFRHTGRLGMGLLPDYRGIGLGKRLAVETIRSARQAGIERVELEVFASNARAVALYRGLGFVREGVKLRARKLDGQYDDMVLMALLSEGDANGSV